MEKIIKPLAKLDVPLVITGSARKESDTQSLVNRLFVQTEYKLIDLLDHKIYPYDYSGSYPADDRFLLVVEQMLQHKTIVFATPVYWYSMSGLMKTFFDRFTDLVTIQKQLGRQLKGKRIFLLAVGADKELPEGFEVPFRLTAKYLDMEFIASYYIQKECMDMELPDITHIIAEISRH